MNRETTDESELSLGRSAPSREQEARMTLGRTTVRPALALALSLAFIFPACLFFVLQGFSSRKPGTDSGAAIFAGRNRQEAETALENQSAGVQWLRPRVQQWLTGKLKAGSEQAYVGRRGWLFYRPDVEYVTSPGFWGRAQNGKHDGSESLRAIVQMKNELDARGVQLLVVPVPVKSSLEPEMLSPRADVLGIPLENVSYSQWRDALRAQGVRVFDPARALAGDKLQAGQHVFLQTDTHWTPAAMERTASCIADIIQEEIPLLPKKNRPYRQSSKPVTGEGDLTRMLHLDAPQSLFPPEHIVVDPVSFSTGQPWQPEADADILVVGDSFTKVYSTPDLGWGSGAGLAEHLSLALQRPVDRLAVNAGGASASRQRLWKILVGDKPRMKGKRLIIYEFAIRELTGGDWTLWPSRRMVPRIPEVSVTDENLDRPLVIQARVLEAAPTPAPGSSVYSNCVIELRLSVVKTIWGTAPRQSLRVLMLGLDNNRRTDAASLVKGQLVTVRLTSWRRVESIYGGYQRSELNTDDTENAEMPQYWGVVTEK